MGMLVVYLIVMMASSWAGRFQARNDADLRGAQSEFVMTGAQAPIVGWLRRCNEHHCIIQTTSNVFVVRLADIARINSSGAAVD